MVTEKSDMFSIYSCATQRLNMQISCQTPIIFDLRSLPPSSSHPFPRARYKIAVPFGNWQNETPSPRTPTHREAAPIGPPFCARTPAGGPKPRATTEP